MALDITLFEVNLPQDVFTSGSQPTGTDKRAQQGSPSGQSEQGGRSKGKMLLALVALVGIGLAVKKLRSGGSDEEEIEMTYEQPGVEVERTNP